MNPPNVDKVGSGFCPECVRKAGSGIAADQTNAMLATSKGGDFSFCGRSPLFLQHWRKLAACSGVGCLLVLAVKAAHSGSCGLTRVDRVNPRRVDTFGTVQLDDALSVASAENDCNAGLS